MKKITKVTNILKKEKVDYLFISASENIAWLLNIRGTDSDFSPLPNCFLVIDKFLRIYLFCDLNKIDMKFKKKLNFIKIFEINELEKFLNKISNKNFLIDSLTCSVFFKNIIEKYNIVKINTDPIYYLKSQKNNREIKNIKKIHEYDGASLTKFLFWIQNNFKKKKNYRIISSE